MLNKKGTSEVPGISPFKMVMTIIILIILCVILIVSLKFLSNTQKNKTEIVVESVLAKDRWYDIMSRKVNEKPFPDILQEYWNLVTEKDDTLGGEKGIKDKIALLEKKIFQAVKESVEEILPENLVIENYRIFYDSEKITCRLEVWNPDLTKGMFGSHKKVSSMLEAAGFGSLTFKLYHKEKVRNKSFLFTIYVYVDPNK